MNAKENCERRGCKVLKVGQGEDLVLKQKRFIGDR